MPQSGCLVARIAAVAARIASCHCSRLRRRRLRRRGLAAAAAVEERLELVKHCLAAPTAGGWMIVRPARRILELAIQITELRYVTLFSSLSPSTGEEQNAFVRRPARQLSSNLPAALVVKAVAVARCVSSCRPPPESPISFSRSHHSSPFSREVDPA